MIYTCLIDDKILTIVYNFYINFFFIKTTFILLKIKKDILKTIFILILLIKKVF